MSDPVEGTHVVLVHGLWLRGFVLSVQRRRLMRNGFSVSTFSYPSVKTGLDANSRALAAYISVTPGNTINFVGHSLGGLVILNLLAKACDRRIRRVVLLGSPCAGSHSASMLLRLPFLAPAVGCSLRDALEIADWRIPDGVEVGVISGRRSIGLGRLLPDLPAPNDGVVSVRETELPGRRDAITLPVSHSEMLVSRSCTAQIESFLRSGRFIHD